MSSKRKTQGQQQWLRRQAKDPFVKAAKAQGYPSRAVFKLKDLQAKDRLCHPGMHVVDLGAAPGSWSKIVSEWVGVKGHVYALDILEMSSLADVTFIQGDFADLTVYESLLNCIDQTAIDLVISDMAPNFSGIRCVDQPKSMLLVELVLEFCHKVLKKDGAMVVKVFQGEGFEAYLRQVRQVFKSVRLRKPESSRKDSREQYLVAKGFSFP